MKNALTQPGARISIAVLDDDSLIVDLLKDFFDGQEEIDVLYTATDGAAFLEMLKTAEQLPEVLLLDLKMKGLDGVEITEYLRLHYPSVLTIVVSSYYNRTFMGFMLKTGAAAFIPKGVSPTKLVGIIREVRTKGYYFMEDQVEIIREQLSGKAPKPVLDQKTGLSEREIEILVLISRQKTAREIGDQLFITQRTVEGHKNNLFAKTGAKNTAGLVIFALQHNIVRLEDIPVI